MRDSAAAALGIAASDDQKSGGRQDDGNVLLPWKSQECPEASGHEDTEDVRTTLPYLMQRRC